MILIMAALFSRAQFPVQNGSNLRQKMLFVSGDSLQIDTTSIIPQTFTIEGVPAINYRLDFIRGFLVWNKKPDHDTLLVSYRVFPYRLNQVSQHLVYDSIAGNMSLRPYEFNNELTEAERGVFNFGRLQAEGSFGRQLAFGNSQDAVLNSTLNLQLSGLLGDSIEIQAAITDNNIPIQPDGTTQQLNEFDKVFLQFSKRNWQLNLGDIDIRQNQSYFLNFYKRLQGISFQTTNRLGPHLESKTLASGSIAKGKFTRNIIQALEGNQGPYRLKGANNEFFFIVLANTERVFVDGQLLQRGEDQDYVINYNTAEITFTPKKMITKDSRIQVEFEYADRSFLNANFYVSQEFDLNRKLKIRVGAFTNSDAKNSQINQELDSDQKQFLSTVGDNIKQAFYPSATLDTFAANKILYQKIYYNTGTGIDSLYKYSTNPDSAKYNLSFAFMGEHNGNYVTDVNGANGKVYRFIDPVGGVKQGDYEPISILVTPKKQQVMNLGIDYSIAKSTLLKTEVAASNYDPNTFSKLSNGDHQGYAAKTQLTNTTLLKAKNQLQLISSLDYEYVQDKFRPLERLRTVEFSRDWGLPLNVDPLVDPQTENIIRASTGLKNNKGHSFNYRFTNYTRGDNYKGYQNAINHLLNWKGWQVNNEVVVTNFNALDDKGVFLRPTVDMSKQFRKLANWRLGFRYALEENTVRNKNTDTLTRDAFSFDSYSVYLKSNEARKNRYGITFFTRSDKYKVIGEHDFVRGDRSYNLNLQTELMANEHRQFLFNATFRKLKVYDEKVSPQKEDETILGRAEYIMNELKGLLTGNVLYEVGAGQEQKRDIAYLEVPAGTGQYAWIDYNNDGVQQLNEFELAAFPDQAKYFRIFTPTNEFLKANYITFNYSLNLNPRALLNKSDLKGMSNFVSRINLSSSMQISKKSISKGDFEFDPFKYDVNDTALVTLNTVFLNTVSFNRFSTAWGIDFTNLRNNGKALLTYGYESREVNDWNSKLRVNISRSFLLTTNVRTGTNSLLTPNAQFDNRNYKLGIRSLEPMLSFIHGTDFRIGTSYRYEDKKNAPVYGGEKSVAQSINVDTKYNVLQNSSISAKFTYSHIDFESATGTAASTVSYIMLDGLLPGKNYLWNLTLTKRLLKNLELNFQYDGRRPAASKTVHIGRASLTALF